MSIKTVFLSYTARDLAGYRQAVTEAIRCRCINVVYHEPDILLELARLCHAQA
jgi:hypothetical protein